MLIWGLTLILYDHPIKGLKEDFSAGRFPIAAATCPASGYLAQKTAIFILIEAVSKLGSSESSDLCS